MAGLHWQKYEGECSIRGDERIQWQYNKIVMNMFQWGKPQTEESDPDLYFSDSFK